MSKSVFDWKGQGSTIALELQEVANQKDRAIRRNRVKKRQGREPGTIRGISKKADERLVTNAKAKEVRDGWDG